MHLAVHVELELAVTAALPMRTGVEPLVARQPRQLAFGQPTLAGDAVHDLQLRRVAGDRAQQPVAPRARLVAVAAACISA